ncbi:MAG TPA: LytR C-terminal domain-containing protein [Candidatus Saccharimonadales bacterium]|nr:LytR C-terminal domain-containing protein [Candidatus Saccharimonadales bacterium]
MQNRYYMKDEVPFSDFPAYTEDSSNKSRKFAVILVIIIIIAAIVGGLYFLGKNKNSESKIVVTPTEAPTETPTDIPSATPSGSITPSAKLTPTPTGTSTKLDRSKLSIEVLNGSGVVGAGKKIADYLSGLGYKIASTGNADAFDFKGITIKVNKANSDYAALLKKDLSDQASGSAVTASVDDTIKTDAAVIVGK